LSFALQFVTIRHAPFSQAIVLCKKPHW